MGLPGVEFERAPAAMHQLAFNDVERRDIGGSHGGRGSGQLSDSVERPERHRLTCMIGAGIWISAAAAYFVLEGAAASAYEQYSYAKDMISQLGVPFVSPLAYMINAALFCEGIFFLTGAVLIAGANFWRKPGSFLSLSALFAIGTVLVGSAHNGNTQLTDFVAVIHYLGAHLSMVGGNAAVIAGALSAERSAIPRWYRPVSLALGAFGLFAFLMMSLTLRGFEESLMPAGTWERGSVYAILVWQFMTGVLIVLRRFSGSRIVPIADLPTDRGHRAG